MYYCDKAVCMKADFLGSDGYVAMKPKPMVARLAKSPGLKVAAAAAASAVAYVAMKRK